jgi:hypothetical protein
MKIKDKLSASINPKNKKGPKIHIVDKSPLNYSGDQLMSTRNDPAS